MALPIFLSKLAFDVGIPVSRANFCFACVMPNALFHEKDNPGMPVFDLRLIFMTFYGTFLLLFTPPIICAGSQIDTEETKQFL